MRSLLRRSPVGTLVTLVALLGAGTSIGCEGELSGTGEEDTGFVDDTGLGDTTVDSTTDSAEVAVDSTPDTTPDTTTDVGTDTRPADADATTDGADGADTMQPTDAPVADDASDAATDDAGDTATDDTSGATDSETPDTFDAGGDVGCEAPTLGALFVSATGDDTIGNGSAACPFKTIGKALGTTGVTSVNLVAGTAGPVIFGDGCTGGPPCDAMPIDLQTAGALLTIRGSGAAADVVVQGSATSAKVFGIAGGGVTFEALTIRPVMTGAANTGAHGLVFDSPTLGNDGAVRNVIISGGALTGTGIIAKNAATVLVGPQVTITGGFHALLMDVASGDTQAPSISVSGSAIGAVTMSGAAGACVYVKSASATQTPTLTLSSGVSATNQIDVRDCGPAGAIVIDTVGATTGSSIARTTIGRTGTSVYPGISLLGAATLSASLVNVSGLGASGITIAGSAKLTSPAGLTVTGNAGAGIQVSGTGAIDLTGASITGQTGATGNGIFCDGTSATAVKLRSTKLLANAQNGLRVLAGCGLDVAPTATTEANVFNTATQPNLLSGVCSQSLTGFDYTNNRFRCAAPPATGCAAGTPTESKKANNANFACTAAVDYTIINGQNATVAGAECCQSVP